MDKKIWIVIILIIILIGFGIYLFANNSNDNKITNGTSENSTKSNNDNNTNNSTNSITQNNTNNTIVESNTTSYTSKKTITANSTDNNISTSPSNNNTISEKEIASFSTKIYTKDSERQNNVKITCSTLNNTDVSPGNTFSFTNTVGKATSSKGYQEADIYTNGQKTKGLGGGNCQVSTTLYNAVLKVNGLSVTERHEHSNDVPYIKEGKDAAVAYGSYDFQFVNNLNHTVRIKASATDNNVTIKLMKLE